MIMGLHHVQITIPKGCEEQGKDFYCRVLGLQEVEKPDSLKGRGDFGYSLVNRRYMSGQRMASIV